MTTAKGDPDDPEITVDTELPIPVEPPPQSSLQLPIAAVPVDTDATATPVEDGDEQDVAAAPDEPSVTVVAPQTLPGGYTFPAQVDGIDFIVTVPAHGVVEGQQFRVPYPTMLETEPSADLNTDIGGDDSNVHVASPTPDQAEVNPLYIDTESDGANNGRWRNRLCDCGQIFCRPLCLCACFCGPIVFGQLAQRLKLNCFAFPSKNYHRTCLVTTTALVLFICSSLFQTTVGTLLSFVWYMYIWIFSTYTRYYYRKKYKIPVTSCTCFDGRLDDFFYASLCCGTCVCIQIARHTHDIKQYPYKCCSATGLDPTVPEIV